MQVQQADACLAVLQLHEHMMISLQGVSEGICFGSTALQQESYFALAFVSVKCQQASICHLACGLT